MGTGNSKNKPAKDNEIARKPKALTKRQKTIILRQQSKSLCEIYTKNGKAAGFLSKIPTPVLITNNHILNEIEIQPGKEINIDFIDEDENKNRKTIRIDDERITYSIGKFNDEDIDVTIIEIKPEEDDLTEQEFIEVDKNLMMKMLKICMKKRMFT